MMNHGGIGYLDETQLWLPLDLVRPLSVEDGTRLVGVYYPPPSSDGSYGHVSMAHDFMITPIPWRLWPTTSRLVVRIWHRPHTLEAVTSVLEQEDVNILTAECTRSGHRYATWNLTVSFNRLLKGIDSVNDFHSKTELELKRLKDRIKSACASDLFVDNNDPDLADSVECLPIRALWYFYERMLQNKGGWFHEPFELEYQSGIFQGDDFRTLLIELSKKNKNFLPSCVFAEMDTKDTNIRIVVIPSDRLGRFYRARVKYERTGGSSSRGFLKHVLGNLPKEYNIWRTFNHIARNTPQQELGSINLYFEDVSPGDIDPKRCFEHAQAIFSSLQHCQAPQHLADLRIVDARVGAIDTNYIKSKIQRERGKSEYDVFLSYAFKDGAIAGKIRDTLECRGITVFMAQKEIQGGDVWADRIRETLTLANEVCILCTKDSVNREWIVAEYGAAWSLKKRMVPLLYGIEIKELPVRLQGLHARDFSELDRYVDEVRTRIASAEE